MLRFAGLALAGLFAIGIESAGAQEPVTYAALPATPGTPGVEINAFLFTPQTPGRHAAIVFMHGCGGALNKSGHLEARQTAWGTLLEQEGYVVLAEDSFTSRHQGSQCSRGDDLRVNPKRERVRDAYGALQWLSARPDVDPRRIAVMGWSQGGGAVLFTVSEHLEIGELPADVGRFKAAIAFYPGSCNYRNQDTYLTRVPLLVLQGASDVWTPAEPCESIIEGARQRGSPAEIHIYPSAYHDFDWPGMPIHTLDTLGYSHNVPIVGENEAAHADAIERVKEFLARYLATAD
jgi:dienelactone hydrolase